MSVSLQFGRIVMSWNPTCSCLEDKAEWLLSLDLLNLQSQPLTMQSQRYFVRVLSLKITLVNQGFQTYIWRNIPQP